MCLWPSENLLIITFVDNSLAEYITSAIKPPKRIKWHMDILILVIWILEYSAKNCGTISQQKCCKYKKSLEKQQNYNRFHLPVNGMVGVNVQDNAKLSYP